MFPKIKPPKKRIYLDHAATTPLDPSVEKVMRPFWQIHFGNPSSLYKEGREAKAAIDQARKTIADLIDARPNEIIFTAGGTESVNLAIFGAARNHKVGKRPPHLITSKIEHHAVLKSFEALEGEGYKASYIDVDKQGFINLDKLKAAVRPETILISVMYANNEIGTVEPIMEMGKWLKAENAKRQAQNLSRILFHTDACQAAGALDINVNYLGVDLLTANGSKIYGPKQSGFLYIRSGIAIKPLIYGGGQERNLRSGTENVPGIVGLAEAFRLAQKNRLKENKRLRALRDYFINQIFKKIPEVILNGPDERKLKVGDTPLRLPNNINISIPGVEGEALILYLDSYGISASTGSACSSVSQDPSHVIEALGREKKFVDSSIRFALGKQTRKKDIEYVLKILSGLIIEFRKVSRI